MKWGGEGGASLSFGGQRGEEAFAKVVFRGGMFSHNPREDTERSSFFGWPLCLCVCLCVCVCEWGRNETIQ